MTNRNTAIKEINTIKFINNIITEIVITAVISLADPI